MAAKGKKVGSVNEFMAALKHPLKPEVEAVRQVILGANDQIREEVKWNAPSFLVEENFATFNLHTTEFVQLIFHLGTRPKAQRSERITIHDPAGILEWLSIDRGMVRFYTMEEVQTKKLALVDLVNQWIKAM